MRFIDILCCKVRPEVEITVLHCHLAEISLPIIRPPSASYKCSIYIAHLALAVNELLSPFSVVKRTGSGNRHYLSTSSGNVMTNQKTTIGVLLVL